MKTRKIAYLGMLMALALVLSYVESLIPFAVGIPGVKLGLTNIVTVIMLYIAAPMETFLLCVFRAVLSGFMFGNAFSIIYSLAGCILSFIVMYLLKKSDKFSSVSISLVGGVCHNIGQIIVAAIVLSTYSVVYYIPVLLVAGCITGLVIGIVASQVLLRISDSLMGCNLRIFNNKRRCCCFMPVFQAAVETVTNGFNVCIYKRRACRKKYRQHCSGGSRCRLSHLHTDTVF